MNNYLSKRLLTIANMVEDSKVVYDVGCDHAYLDIFLNKTRNIECYAIDVRKSVLEIAKRNIEKNQLNIPVLLNNGLDNLNLKSNSVVVIAGMGTRNILKIIKNKKAEQIIIQSNDDLPYLRSSLSKLGYKIMDEKLVFESGYYYVLIKFEKGLANYTEEQQLLGPILMLESENETYQKYLKHLVEKYMKMINDVPSNIKDKKKSLERKKEIVLKYLIK